VAQIAKVRVRQRQNAPAEVRRDQHAETRRSIYRRQWLERHRIEQAEHGEIRGDAQCEHGDDDERVAGAAAEDADGVSDVLRHIE
jgi:hypothetical protein